MTVAVVKMRTVMMMYLWLTCNQVVRNLESLSHMHIVEKWMFQSRMKPFLGYSVIHLVSLFTPVPYFFLFFPEELIDVVVKHTHLYSVQQTLKSVDTYADEMKAFTGVQMIMSIVKLPSIRHYWQGSLRYPGVADVMPRNRFEARRRFIHFVDNSSVYDETNKLLKIQPIIDAVRQRCIEIEPEEYHSIDEQIVPSKTKFTKIRQYNP